MTDAHDITEGLDLLGDWLDAKGYTEEAGLCTKAMDEINRLRAENARLREALRPFVELPCAHMARFSGAPDDYATSEMIPYGIIRAARAAMGESDE